MVTTDGVDKNKEAVKEGSGGITSYEVMAGSVSLEAKLNRSKDVTLEVVAWKDDGVITHDAAIATSGKELEKGKEAVNEDSKTKTEEINSNDVPIAALGKELEKDLSNFTLKDDLF